MLRLRRFSRAPVWPVCLVLALALFYAYGMAFLWGSYMFLDLRVYMGGAHRLLLGQDPYSASFTFVHLYATYPPFPLAVLSPLSLVPMHALVYIWSIANLACLAGLGSVALGEFAPTWWPGQNRGRRALFSLLLATLAVIVIQPVRSNFGFGQVNILLITLVVVDVLGRGRRWRGALVGVAAAVKLTPLLYLLLLVLDRDWRAALRGVATFVGVTAGAWLVAPSASASYFLHFGRVVESIGDPAYVSNQSLHGILSRLGMSGTLSTAAWFVLSAAVVLLAALVVRRLLDAGTSPLFALVVMAVACLLASPVSWDHHWSWVVFFPLVVLERSLPRPARVGAGAVVVVAMAAPYWWDGTASSYGIPTGFLHPLADNSLALAGLVFLGASAWALRREISIKDLSLSALFPAHPQRAGTGSFVASRAPEVADAGVGSLSERRPPLPIAALRASWSGQPRRAAEDGAGRPAPRRGPPWNDRRNGG